MAILWTGKDSKNIDDGEHLPLQGQARADLPAQGGQGLDKVGMCPVKARVQTKFAVLIKALSKKFLQETNMNHRGVLHHTALLGFFKPYQARPRS